MAGYSHCSSCGLVPAEMDRISLSLMHERMDPNRLGSVGRSLLPDRLENASKPASDVGQAFLNDINYCYVFIRAWVVPLN